MLTPFAPMFFITSAVTVDATADDAPVTVEVAKAAGEKCPRCWRYVTETVADGPHAGLCLRCDDAIGVPRG